MGIERGVSDYLYDTVILIDALRGHEPAKSELLRHKRNWISRISWTEMLAGARPEEVDLIEDYLRNFSVVELSEEIGRRAAVIRAQRQSINLSDAIILASAQTAGKILVTRNTRDFPPQMPGVRVPYSL
jgi:predicted nucleic acid-binding protein